MLGLLNLVVRNWEVVSLVAYVIFGGLLPIPVDLLGRAMYGLRPGLLNAGLNADGEMVMYAQDFRRGLLELLLGPYRYRVLSDVRKNARSAWNYLLAERVWGRVLLAVLPVLLFFITDRFLYPALLPFILWSAHGLERRIR